MSRHFTLMFIPDSGKSARRLVVSRRVVYLLVAVLLGVTGGLGYIVADYISLDLDQQKFSRLLVENSSQRQQLSKLTRDLEDLRGEMVLLTEAEALVREALNVNSEEPVTIPVGIGGALEASPVGMTELQQQINSLRLAIDLRRESQEEVRDLLNDKQSLFSATPTGWPVKGWMTSYFGMRPSPFSGQRRVHEGLDIAANVGTPVTATADGVVVKATVEPGFGKVVMVDHGYGYRTIYAHNSKLVVKAGTRISRGDKVAEVGNTGRSTGPHLHYEVRLNNAPINPRKFL